MSTLNRTSVGGYLIGREVPMPSSNSTANAHPHTHSMPTLPPTPMPSSSTAPAAPVAAPFSMTETPNMTYAPSPSADPAESRPEFLSAELVRSLSEVKGQAQFLLYLADQIEDSLNQLVIEHDDCQNSFLCRVLGMYSAQLESKHQGLGDKIAETCQEVYVTVREFDAA